MDSLVHKHLANNNDIDSFKNEVAYHIYHNIKHHYYQHYDNLPNYVINLWQYKFPEDGSTHPETHGAIKDTILVEYDNNSIKTKTSNFPVTQVEVNRQQLNDIFMVNNISGLKWVNDDIKFNQNGLTPELIAIISLTAIGGILLIALINITISYYKSLKANREQIGL